MIISVPLPKIRIKITQDSCADSVCHCGPVNIHRRKILIQAWHYHTAYSKLDIRHVWALCPDCITRLPEMRGKWDIAFVPVDVEYELNKKLIRYINAVNEGHTPCF